MLGRVQLDGHVEPRHVEVDPRQECARDREAAAGQEEGSPHTGGFIGPDHRFLKSAATAAD